MARYNVHFVVYIGPKKLFKRRPEQNEEIEVEAPNPEQAKENARAYLDRKCAQEPGYDWSFSYKITKIDLISP